jgi:putative flippase GtrA
MHPDFATTPNQTLADRGRRLATRLHLPTTLVKFLIVGGIGFLINEAVLFVLYDSNVASFMPDKHTSVHLVLFSVSDSRLLLASIIAVEFAIVCQFNLHERWTFRSRNREGNIFARFFKFNAGSIVSPIVTVLAVNLLTPVIRNAAGDDSIIGKAAPYLANSGGVLVGFTWNYLLNSLVIWPHERAEAPAEPS